MQQARRDTIELRKGMRKEGEVRLPLLYWNCPTTTIEDQTFWDRWKMQDQGPGVRVCFRICSQVVFLFWPGWKSTFVWNTTG